jgi:uracil phosphoribosyltransferase
MLNLCQFTLNGDRSFTGKEGLQIQTIVDKQTVTCLKHPLVWDLVRRLRDQSTPPADFRAAIRMLSLFLFYEATQDLDTETVEVQTPLAVTTGIEIKKRVGLIPILRAGLGMTESIHQVIPEAEVWHLGLYRDEETVEAISYYSKLSAADPVEVAFVLDPMIATGGTLIRTVGMLKEWGVDQINILSVIASEEGIENVHGVFPDTKIYVTAIDPDLNAQSFIVPGLGDAGDRQFGTG